MVPQDELSKTQRAGRSANVYLLLPQLQMPFPEVPVDEALLSISFLENLSVQTLSAALQNGCTTTAIKKYLQQSDPGLVKKCLKDVQSPSPAIFYAVERNYAETVGTLLSYGADPRSKGTVYNILVIAFAIIYGR